MPGSKKIINIALLASVGIALSFYNPGFKADQMSHSRVKMAYKKHWTEIKDLLAGKDLDPEHMNLYLRVFKQEGILEAWAKNSADKNYIFIRSFPICASSGVLGPKRRQGDGQVPEGFYQIGSFQPESSYHLALQVNYPNASDRLKARAKDPGGDIMIHGNCVTIGCIPIQDDPIESLYIFCIEAKNSGSAIYTDIYPFKFDDKHNAQMEKLTDQELIRFWKSLKQGYDYFEINKRPAKIKTDTKGNYIIQTT